MSDEQTTTDEKLTSSSALIGKKLGDYELTELMAAGGMARIYKGIDRNLNRTAAIKVLMRELMETDETLTDRFLREARAIAALEHDNIVHVYQSGDQDGYYFLAMKYVDGKDLADELNNLRRRGKNMDVKRALRILGQVASALDYAHSFDIIHRDIKPSNILLDKNDKAILTDFGLALWQSVDKTMGTAFGTPRYISPEQALASEKSVPQSDIYSLAVVLYEILTGDMLFRADTPMQIALSHISEPPPPPRSINPNIPEAVEKELLKALAKDPKKRHHTATEFITAVEAAYGTDLDKADAPTPPPITGTQTPVLSDEDKRALFSTAPKPVTQEESDTHQGRSRSNPALAGVSERPKAPKRNNLPVFIIGIIILAALGGGAAFILSSGNPDNQTTDRNTQVANDTSVTGSPTSEATKTPIPASAANSPLLLNYSWEAVVFVNRTDERLTVRNLEITWNDGLQSREVPTNDLSPNGCATIYQSYRDFERKAGALKCTGNQKISQVNTDAQYFWRDTTSQRFEVRLNGEVIGRCNAIGRDVIVDCPLAWPEE